MSSEIIRQYIQDTLLIDDPVSAEFVPFILRPIQNKYYDQLVNDYGSEFWLNDVDEIIVKARKEGFTSLILGMFASVMHLYKVAKRFLEISYKEDASKQHYRRMQGFLLSPIVRDPKNWNEELKNMVFESHSEGSEMVLKHNKSSFYVGTATSRTGERGGTVQGILFTEAAHYPDTGIISASEIIEGTRQQVSVGSGLKFIETTANGWNHLKKRCEQAQNKEISAKLRFYGWQEFYTPEQFKVVCHGISDKSLIPQEYPETIDEAFLATGRPAFQQAQLKEMFKKCSKERFIGEIEDDGAVVKLREDVNGLLKVWKVPKINRRYLISCDVAEGVKGGAYSVAQVIDRTSWEQVAVWRGHIDPSDFGQKLVDIAYWYNNALIIPENNNHGWATIGKIKEVEYPHLFKTTTIWSDDELRGIGEKFGFPTGERTKPLIISALRNAIDDMSLWLNDETTVKEIMGASINEQGKVVAHEGYYLDCMMSLAIGVYCLKFLTLDETYRDADIDKPFIVSSMVSKRDRTGHAGYR